MPVVPSLWIPESGETLDAAEFKYKSISGTFGKMGEKPEVLPEVPLLLPVPKPEVVLLLLLLFLLFFELACLCL